MNPKKPQASARLGALFAALSLTACGVQAPLLEPQDGPPTGSVSIPDLPDDPTPRDEPRSRYGNSPEYEVFGQRYRILETSRGYSERGVASWYGTKFHGKLTSNRETYDMFAMSAAHKTLPLPSYVRVTNLSNQRSVVVRVNDRGPFAHNRIIDLSYAAAIKLDMVDAGTALVHVESLEPQGAQPTRASRPSNYAAPGQSGPVFVQVGAFGSRDNAVRLERRLWQADVGGAFIDKDASSGSPLYRVRVGPVKSVEHYDALIARLAELGITKPYLVSGS